MSRRSRAAQKLAAQKEKEELARKKAAEASQTKHLSKYAAKKMAQMAAAQKYSDAVDDDNSSQLGDEQDSNTSSSATATSANAEQANAPASDGKLTPEQISAKVTSAVNKAIPNSSSGPRRRKIRSVRVRGGTVLRSSIETPAEQEARERKEAKIKAEEAKLPPKVREGRIKRRKHIEDIRNARMKALEEIEARGETYKQLGRDKDKIPDKITFNREVVMTCGIETKDRMPDLTDPLEREAALAPHNRRDSLLFAPIKRHNKPITGTDFMVKFLDQWEERMDKGGIFAPLFAQVKETRRSENGIAYIGLPAFLKFLEGTSKRLIIDQYAFEFNLYIKRREITDFIASMKAPALAWMAHRHPMDPFYAFVYLDTYPVRIKLGKKRVYVEQELFMIGVTLDGRKDLLGIIPDFTNGRLSVDFWERILEHFKLLGTREICFMVAGFKCRYLERAVKQIFPNTTLQFNLLEVLQFDSFRLPTELRKPFMEDATALCEAPSFEVAKAQLDLMRNKWEHHLPEGTSVLQGNIDQLQLYTYLSPEERKIFTTHKMIAGAASLLLGKKDPLDFFSDHAEMLNYFFYRYLLVAKLEWLEHQDYAIQNLTFSHIFAQLRHSEVSGGLLLNELLNQQHQDFMYRHFGRFGTGPVFNLNPNRRKISLSGQIEPFRNLQQVWGDELLDEENAAQQQLQQQAAAEAQAIRQRAQEQAQAQYEQEQRAAAASLAAAAQGAAATAAAIAQASNIEATAVAALGGANTDTPTSTTLSHGGVKGAILGTSAAPKVETNDNASIAGLKLGDAALPAFILDDAKTLNLQTATQNALQPKLRSGNRAELTGAKASSAQAMSLQQSNSQQLTETERNQMVIDAAHDSEQQELCQNLRTSDCLSSSYATEQSTRPASWSKLGTKDSYLPEQQHAQGNYYLETPIDPDQFNTLQNKEPIVGLEKIDSTYGVQELPPESGAVMDKAVAAKATSPSTTAPTGTTAAMDSAGTNVADATDAVQQDQVQQADSQSSSEAELALTSELASETMPTSTNTSGYNQAPYKNDRATSYMQVQRQQDAENPYALNDATPAGLINRYGSYTMDMAGTVNEEQMSAFDEFEALSPKATAPSAYLMNNVSSNIQSANAVLGMLKPSIAQALRADRQQLKNNERQQILNCLGGNFNFTAMDNVIHQVTPIFRSAMQTKLNWYANHKKEEEAKAKAKAKAKARSRYLKRQEIKAAAAAEQAAHQPVRWDSFVPLQSINDLNVQGDSLNPQNGMQEISSLRESDDLNAQGLQVTLGSSNPFAMEQMGSGAISGTSLKANDSGDSNIHSTNNVNALSHPQSSNPRQSSGNLHQLLNETSVGTTLEVDFAQQQLKMQPVLGAGQEMLQFAAQAQSSIKVAPTLMTSLISNSDAHLNLHRAHMQLDVSTGEVSRPIRRRANSELNVDPSQANLSLAPDLLQMSTQHFNVQGTEQLLHKGHHESPHQEQGTANAGNAGNAANTGAPAESDNGEHLHIEKTTDFNGPVPAPELRSLFAETLATPAGVKTAALDGHIKLNSGSDSEHK